MQGEQPAMRVSDSEGKLDSAPSPQNHRAASKGGGNKAWQYSDHMEYVCGYLMKYTNLVTGWQYRFFVLNNEAGLLEYFVNEQSRNQKPRGTVQLAGAVISPSDEDSHTFTVNAASGEQYKLRASDAKQRQHWVSRLQICTQHHTEAIGKNNPPLQSRSFSVASQGSGASPLSQRRPSHSAASIIVGHHRALPTNRRGQLLQPDHLGDVREMMSRAEGQQRDLMRCIEGLPAAGHLRSLDQDLLMLKATSTATLNCLNDCFHILHQQHASLQQRILPHETAISWLEPKILLPDHLKNGEDPNIRADDNKEEDSLGEKQEGSESSQLTREPEEIDSEDELEDTCDLTEDELGAVEEQRSIILHLLSQLKLGMDLTRVVLPTFILEKRSLLEMYADFLSHPDLFLSIGTGSSPEERMVKFVEYYLTSFHEGRKGALAKKPYNPIIGESFHCSWRVPKDVQQPPKPCEAIPSVQDEALPSEEADTKMQDFDTVRFVAEQVSHHPPVSGFYAECPERRMCVNTHVWTKSKFMGMSVGVTMIGEGVLYLLEHGEEYTFSLPCAYARSILTVPWVELGGKVYVNCAKSGYSAAITFHTKPFYGGKLHRVTAEVKHGATNTVVCKVQGEWNSVLEFTYSSGETRCIDLTTLPVTRKRVRPVDKQGLFESRRLWQHVTESLSAKNIETATEHKRALEERQRAEERHRAETETPWDTKYFTKEGDGWIYYKPLCKSSESEL